MSRKATKFIRSIPKADRSKGYQNVTDVPVENLDRVSLYVPPTIGIKLLEEIAAKGCNELWLNPGSENEELVVRARALGFDPILACSIVDVGVSPGELGDS